jgi:hypothetical protein
MPFGMFKKKKEVLDLRPRDSDMPIPNKIKERLISVNSSGGLGLSSSSNSSSSLSPIIPSGSIESSSQTSSGNENSGGFFSFFGGSDSSSNSSSSSLFSNSTLTSSDLDKTDSKVNDLHYRFSRLLDRVELLEKKMDRLERKDGTY